MQAGLTESKEPFWDLTTRDSQLESRPAIELPSSRRINLRNRGAPQRLDA
jgi:hypothetical protein